jgi:hypothetical protein
MTEDSVRDRVIAYLKDREDWERRSHADYEAAIDDGTSSAVLDRIIAERSRFLSQHLTKSAADGAPSGTFGDPAGVQAKTTVILSSEISPNRIATVRTRERSLTPGGSQEFVYELLEEPLGWRISDRRTQDDRGRWIRHLV